MPGAVLSSGVRAFPTSSLPPCAPAVAVALAAMAASPEPWSLIAQRVLTGADGGMALLAVLGCGWLLWRSRARLVPGVGDARAGLVALGSVLVLPAARSAELHFPAQAAALLPAPALAALFLRPGAFGALLPAWGALLLALPIPGWVVEHVAVPLQFAEARAVEVIALLAGLEVARDGVVVSLRGTPVSIDEGCSGFGLLWPVLLAVWVAVHGARSGPTGILARSSAFLLAAPVALLANLCRIVCSVLAHAFAEPAVAGLLHDVVGWVLVVATGWVPLLLLGAGAGRPVVPVRGEATTRSGGPRASALALALCVLGAASLGGSGAGAAVDAGARLDRHLEALPWRLDRWVGARRALPPREAELLGADAVVHRAYVDLASGEELLLVAAWHRDASAAEGHGAEKCYRVRGWQLEDVVTVPSSAAGERTRRFHFRRGGTRLTVHEAVIEAPRPATSTQGRGGGRLRVLLVREGLRGDLPTVHRFVEALGVVADRSHRQESV